MKWIVVVLVSIALGAMVLVGIPVADAQDAEPTPHSSPIRPPDPGPATNQIAGGASFDVVESGDELFASYDCSTFEGPSITWALPPAIVAVDVGDDPGDAAGPGADAIRWTLNTGVSRYISFINCENLYIFTGQGNETLTVEPVDSSGSVKNLILYTVEIDAVTFEAKDEVGNDRVIIGSGVSNLQMWIETGDGQDLVSVASGHAGYMNVDAGRGNDQVTTGAGFDEISGGGGDDILDGGAGDDMMFGGEGNDRIDGRAGKDRIRGQNGNDTINGGPDNDNLNGNNGNDIVNGGDGHDYVAGKDGEDTLNGGRGTDTVNGGGKSDIMNGGDGNDTMNGNGFKDIIHGNKGNDVIAGGDGPDIIYGDDGNDKLDGNRGNDQLFGGKGSDFCEGRTGFDTANSCETTKGIP